MKSFTKEEVRILKKLAKQQLFGEKENKLIAARLHKTRGLRRWEEILQDIGFVLFTCFTLPSMIFILYQLGDFSLLLGFVSALIWPGLNFALWCFIKPRILKYKFGVRSYREVK